MSERFAATERQVSTTVEGEAVILHMSTGVYYGLDAVGAGVWELLQTEPRTMIELRDEVCSRYDVGPERAEDDLRSLLDDLLAAGLVEPRG
jgi:hypothetical protein